MKRGQRIVLICTETSMIVTKGRYAISDVVDKVTLADLVEWQRQMSDNYVI